MDLHKVNFKKYTKDGYRIVKKMPSYLFKACLVENFDIKYENKQLQWPRHAKKQRVI